MRIHAVLAKEAMLRTPKLAHMPVARKSWNRRGTVPQHVFSTSSAKRGFRSAMRTRDATLAGGLGRRGCGVLDAGCRQTLANSSVHRQVARWHVARRLHLDAGGPWRGPGTKSRRLPCVPAIQRRTAASPTASRPRLPSAGESLLRLAGGRASRRSPR